MTEQKMGWISGWKMIAEYCDVTEATVKRYAREKDMPVRRLGNKVFAIPGDLDKWLREKTC
ncbi:MAG TPA: hypothetical protein DHV36_16210 [Desulfobacteraceae bacterium]|nr:hypothetical protein [Desulfobacteraceae bacterium]